MMNYNKTERQLLFYEIIFKCHEIEIPNVMKRLSASKKTIQRDIDDLTDAGLIRLWYSKKDNVYKKDENLDVSNTIIAESEGTRRYMHLKKLRRLVVFMFELSNMEDARAPELENYNPRKRYFELFPDVSERTRMRDYKTLKKIGYGVYWDYLIGGYFTSGHLYDADRDDFNY